MVCPRLFCSQLRGGGRIREEAGRVSGGAGAGIGRRLLLTDVIVTVMEQMGRGVYCDWSLFVGTTIEVVVKQGLII